jgi:hypothetical protein
MLTLCRFCIDEPPSQQAGERCAHPECPHDGAGATVSTRLAPRTPTRPSLVDGPRAAVVAPEEPRPVPHIGTQPSLSGSPPGGRR